MLLTFEVFNDGLDTPLLKFNLSWKKKSDLSGTHRHCSDEVKEESDKDFTEEILKV